MRELLVAKLQKARQNYINISETNHIQARVLALRCAGVECMELRLELHRLDTDSE
jgi:hypothetical protein